MQLLPHHARESLQAPSSIPRGQNPAFAVSYISRILGRTYPRQKNWLPSEVWTRASSVWWLSSNRHPMILLNQPLKINVYELGLAKLKMLALPCQYWPSPDFCAALRGQKGPCGLHECRTAVNARYPLRLYPYFSAFAYSAPCVTHFARTHHWLTGQYSSFHRDVPSASWEAMIFTSLVADLIQREQCHALYVESNLPSKKDSNIRW